MKVIVRHGARKPTSEDLLKNQFGYDTSDNVYGKHEGKTLFIRDEEQGVIDVTRAYLKEEFINYCLPCDKDGNVDQDGSTVYEESTEPIVGILENLTSQKKDVYDDSGNIMGEKVSFGAYTVNTKDHKFTKPSVGAVQFYSVNPEYLQKLKNSLEQKAIVAVDTHASMIVKAHEMANNKTLEAGVQFIVKHDEKNNEDTWLYVVTNYDGTVSSTETEDRVDTITVYPEKESTGTEHSETDEGPEAGETYALQPVMAMEYLFHDPIAKDFRNNGLTVEVGEKNEKENTIELGLNKKVEDSIICAHDNAFSKTSQETFIGVDLDDAKDATNEEITDIVAKARKNGQSYTNFIKFYQKNFNTAGDEDLAETIREIVDFNNFVLDEGTWDTTTADSGN